ncbi:TPA: hypothetical protein O8U18_004085 [Enterobacter cloacae]|nr:hypothetical protein [Enterobacter cloacae]HDC4542423.1 hypothetical protein [Enterobacter cloacae]
MHDSSSDFDKIINIIIVLAVEHWIVASLVVGLIMYLIGAAINENAQTNIGAITSGVIGVCGQLIFGFGVLASIVGIVKFLWIHA